MEVTNIINFDSGEQRGIDVLFSDVSSPIRIRFFFRKLSDSDIESRIESTGVNVYGFTGRPMKDYAVFASLKQLVKLEPEDYSIIQRYRELADRDFIDAALVYASRLKPTTKLEQQFIQIATSYENNRRISERKTPAQGLPAVS